MREVVGRREARRPGADHRDLACRWAARSAAGRRRRAQIEVGDVALDVVDADRLVEHAPAAALDLAGAGADAAADRRQRVGVLDELDRVLVLADRRQGDVALDVDPGRAGELAGARCSRRSGSTAAARAPPCASGAPRASRSRPPCPRHLRGAGGHERPGALHLDHADEARGERLELRVVAQRRDAVDAVLAGRPRGSSGRCRRSSACRRFRA